LDQFSNVGLRGDSIRRSIAFFLAAAKDAGIKLSPYFDKIQSRSGAPKRNGSSDTETPSAEESNPEQPKGWTPRRQSKQQEQKQPPSPPRRQLSDVDVKWAEQLLLKFPEFDPAWADDVKVKWFDAFDRLMKGHGM
jgi:hypothetical protein